MLHLLSKESLIEGWYSLALGVYSLAFATVILPGLQHPDTVYPVELILFGAGGILFCIRGVLMIGLSIVDR